LPALVTIFGLNITKKCDIYLSAITLDGLVLYYLFHHWHKKVGIALIALLLITPATIGVFNTFPPPIVSVSNSQVTYMEMTGMELFLDHRRDSLLIDK